MYFKWPFEKIALYLGNSLFILGVVVDNDAQRSWPFWLALVVLAGELWLTIGQLRVWLKRPAK